MANLYGKTSQMRIETKFKDNKTYMSDVFYTPPLKLTRPFKQADGGLYIIMMSSSPGIMDGDVQDFEFNIDDNSNTHITSQTYEKIYKTIDVPPVRNTKIKVGSNAYFKYFPLPTIPFKDSSFSSETIIELKDESSRFSMVEIISCGRQGLGEKFEYKSFKLLTEVKKKKELVYVDNTNFIPDEINMENFGMLEGYTHLGNILLFNFDIKDEELSEYNEIIQSQGLDGGVSRTFSKDVVIRVMGYSAVELKGLAEEIIERAEGIHTTFV